VLRITEILTDNAKPSIGPRPKREKVVAPAAEGDDEAPKAAKKKAPAKKAAAKPAAKKAPAKKAAAKD
jgi:large subunit ribosomal protein L21